MPATINPEPAEPLELLDTHAAARLLGLAPASLDLDRCRHRLRIPYLKIGRRVLYRRADLMAFIDRCQVGGVP